MSGESLHWVEQATAENDATLADFGVLIDTAVDLCLQDRSAFEERLKNAPPLRKAHLWGGRAALEVYFLGGIHSLTTEDDQESYHDVLSKYEEFMPPAQPEVMAKIEAFGQSLLDEAFNCLGEDAVGMAEAYSQATRSSQQVKILDWLEKRVMQIDDHRTRHLADTLAETVAREAEQYENLADEEIIVLDDLPEIIVREPIEITEAMRNEPREIEYIHLDDLTDFSRYHPLRVSPKFIGKYPESFLDPTCLGKSLLVAAFLEKAGATYMHAGLMHTAVDYGRMLISHMIYGIQDISEQEGIPLPHTLLDKYEEIERIYKKFLEDAVDNGHHAVILTKLIGKRKPNWSQIDPNLGFSARLHPHTAKTLDKIHKNLQDINGGVRGIETAFVASESASARVLLYVMDELYDQLPEESEAVEQLRAMLTAEEPIEAIKQYIRQQVETAESTCLGPDPTKNFILPVVRDFIMKKQDPQTADIFIDMKLDQIIEDYLFPDSSDAHHESSVKRALKDESYLFNRAQDLRMLPFHFVLSFMTDMQNLTIKSVTEGARYTHASMELGLPAYRIGACVLSDISLYTAIDLPFSFWASNWTSYVTMGEHLPTEGSKQYALAARLLDATHRLGLSYVITDGIIQSRLEQEGQNIEPEKVGS